eukprot:COSAG02_NODE_3947_length_5998_cov_201.978464_1_plen_81_part_00
MYEMHGTPGGTMRDPELKIPARAVHTPVQSILRFPLLLFFPPLAQSRDWRGVLAVCTVVGAEGSERPDQQGAEGTHAYTS